MFIRIPDGDELWTSSKLWTASSGVIPVNKLEDGTIVFANGTYVAPTYITQHATSLEEETQ